MDRPFLATSAAFGIGLTLLAALFPPGVGATRATATSGWAPDYTSDVGPVAKVSWGSTCIRKKNPNTPLAADPIGACVAPFPNRIVPPALFASYLAGGIVPQGLGTGTSATDGTNKYVNAAAWVGALGLECRATVFDPITVDPQPIPYTITMAETLADLRFETEMWGGSPDIAGYHRELATSLTGSQPLYTLDVTAGGGSVPVADFSLDPFLVSQGWNESSLESALNAAFAAGQVSPGIYEVPSFPLPDIAVDVPANTALEITTQDETTAETPEGTPIPALSDAGTLALVLLVAGAGVFFVGRRVPTV